MTRTALRVLIFARDRVRAHPATTLAVAGFLAATLIVVAGGRIGTVRSTIPLTDWLGLLSVQGRRKGDLLPGSLMLSGIVLLIGLWLVAIRVYRSGDGSERPLWGIASAWSVPFVVGPPMISNDVWTYAAQGLMLRNGLDPYSVGPSALGNVPEVAAVDPSWRSVPSPYGPLATTVQHLAVSISGGSPLGAAIVFRALSVACFVAIGLLAADLAGPRRIQALVLTILNPLLLIHVISGAHLEGSMCALLLGALVAAHQRRWLLAVVLACAAGAVKAPAFVAVIAIVVMHSEGYRGWRAWRFAAVDTALAVATVLGLSVVVHNGWGWVQALNTPSLGHTSLAPASLLGDLYRPVVTAASFDDLATAGRITTMLAAVCIVVYLAVTARRRALAQTIGYGLIAVGLLGPVLYPWYMLWGVVCLIPTARAERRDFVVLASGFACVFDAPGFTRMISDNLSLSLLAVGGLWFVARMRARSHLAQPATAISGPDSSATPALSATAAVEAEPAVPALETPQVSVGG